MLEKSKLFIPVIIYGFFYMIAFRWLEMRPQEIHIIYSSVDSLIPFCEYFIVPYVLWFFYIAATILFFVYFNDDKSECINMYYNFAIGMTLFIVISYIYPNGLQLRPTIFTRDNIFVHAVQHLYSIDTSTNVLPSIHVYNSMAAFLSLNSCKKLQPHVIIRCLVGVLTFSIVLSTMFLKQHSIIDVVTGIGLSLISYLIVYRLPERSTAQARVRHTVKVNTIR